MGITHSTLGLVHLIFAFAAMLTGAIVLLRSKGTTWHKRIGYVYISTMIGLNVTALSIYQLTGSFVIFHLFAFASLVTIIGGMYPAIRRVKNWLEYHYEFMGWSVIGLYAAFFAELGTRYLPNYFWIITTICSSLTIIIGAFILKRKKRKLIRAKG